MTDPDADRSPERVEPSTPPTTPREVVRPPLGGPEPSLESYNRVAETVGFVPSLRVKDNVVQAIVVFATLVIGLAVGWFISRDIVGIMLGAIGGLLGGLLVSGLVLMVLGWVRAAKGRK